MSKKVNNIRFSKKVAKIKKNSQFLDYSLIEYNEGQLNMDIFKIMKEGYEEMAKINLELSQLPFECENANIDEYENWLCGV
ncbi:hypothetical protein E5347_13110 [Clostridium sartagoforme]|uniref:Uncharacterized protein n=1 Tax=Clostridium sartagoforme TaxID=84031 RepID=A0A4S2DH61_9CLOT|nr:MULTISPECIES: hypothetical protein [Clostridium]MBS5939199.1 hypothetical protein [Clostridium sp.]TGY41416.1 hypothetical protein E5347_13110 [Clostridium sartagoforme]